jgi:uncharacterized protein YdeI (YjbR/CyaY-like superfamily)
MADKKQDQKDLPVLFFETSEEFQKWLDNNYDGSAGVWLRLFRKNSGIRSINYDLALDEALCYGWIDGQSKKFDEQSYIQKFTPRRSRSMWSKRNIENVKRLENDGRMRPSGIKAAKAAEADGRWANSYDSPSNMTIPEDFLKELSRDKKAAEFFNNLSKINKFAITWRLQTARKPETRAKRMKAIIEMLSKGKSYH